ncbi:MAG: cyclase family protein [Acidobacteria bacterium]|nr:cyclase family protein [Acidobacteriota bacterium]MCI0722016.1 cyclase family protein [Acidobacteriota bacterium]
MRNSLLTICLGLFVSISALANDIIEPSRGSSKWGENDERGAANNITPDRVIGAAKLIKTGAVYLMGRLYEAEMPQVSGRQYTLVVPQATPLIGRNRLSWHEEFVASQLGQVGTQLDGLGHVGIGDVYYNGFDQRQFVTPKGLAKLGIEKVGVFFARGVLLDIALLKKKARLEKGYEVTDTDLKQALEGQRIQINPGDCVFVHTGWGGLWETDHSQYTSGEPGIGLSAARFLAQREITLVGFDNWGADAIPGSDPELFHPAHQVLLTQNGIYILENLDTSALARDRVYEFAFFFAPLRLKGATGSPGNPVAIR